MAYVTLIYNNQTYKYGIQFTQNNFFFIYTKGVKIQCESYFIYYLSFPWLSTPSAFEHS